MKSGRNGRVIRTDALLGSRAGPSRITAGSESEHKPVRVLSTNRSETGPSRQSESVRKKGSEMAAPRWTCDVCRQPATGSGRAYGYMEYRYSEGRAHSAEMAEWEARHQDRDGSVVVVAADLDRVPARPRWHILHPACDLEPERADSYWIGLERLDTWHKVAAWSAHLHAKRWFADTDWGEVLSEAGAEDCAA